MTSYTFSHLIPEFGHQVLYNPLQNPLWHSYKNHVLAFAPHEAFAELLWIRQQMQRALPWVPTPVHGRCHECITKRCGQAMARSSIGRKAKLGLNNFDILWIVLYRMRFIQTIMKVLQVVRVLDMGNLFVVFLSFKNHVNLINLRTYVTMMFLLMALIYKCVSSSETCEVLHCIHLWTPNYGRVYWIQGKVACNGLIDDKLPYCPDCAALKRLSWM